MISHRHIDVNDDGCFGCDDAKIRVSACLFEPLDIPLHHGSLEIATGGELGSELSESLVRCITFNGEMLNCRPVFNDDALKSITRINTLFTLGNIPRRKCTVHACARGSHSCV